MRPMADRERADIKTRTTLVAQEPALRARAFESMREGTTRIIVQLAAERTGRTPDDPKVQAWAWAVMGILHTSVFTWLDGGATEDLATIADKNLEFLANGLPL
jgi:uncharacterized phage protein gp47/JayE